MDKKNIGALIATIVLALMFTASVSAASCNEATSTAEMLECGLQDRATAYAKLKAAYSNFFEGLDERGVSMLNAA